MNPRLHRSVSEPSLGTLGNLSHNTRNTGSVGSHSVKRMRLFRDVTYRGKRLWEGRLGKVTHCIMMLEWHLWWQIFVVTGVVYKFIMHLLLAYVLEAQPLWIVLDLTIIMGELVFFTDWVISMLHVFWPAVRYNIRVYRRNLFSLMYDGVTLLPSPVLLLSYSARDLYELSDVLHVTRWLVICRIYRLFIFFGEFNGRMRKSRRWTFIFENIVTWALGLHLTTCLWFAMQRQPRFGKPWYSLGYPPHVGSEKLKFKTYEMCFYYSATHSFNTIFGDSFPLNENEKLLTITMMLFGFCVIRYGFIGTLTCEMVLERWRWARFVEGYHHMLAYLNVCGAPEWLIEQAKSYKRELWSMKNGVLNCDHLNQLPHALQTELIFDINVAYFHSSLLFRDTGEAFMRQVSLLMRHELYLEGQVIWSQGVVKNGMFCIKKGVIEMLSDEDDESPMIAFKEGSVLGELSLFYSIPSKVTVKAATYCELQILKRTDFMRAMLENPQMLKKIRSKILTRLESTTSRQFVPSSYYDVVSAQENFTPYLPAGVVRDDLKHLIVPTQFKQFRPSKYQCAGYWRKAIEEYDKDDSRLIRTRYRPMKLLKDRLAGIDDEDPTFVDDSHLYFRDHNNVRKPKFTEEYLELYNLSYNVTTVDTPRICLKSSFPWILEPDTPFTNLFDIIHFIITIYICFKAPAHAVLIYESDIEEVCECIVIAGLLFNIYLQLTTCIMSKGVKKDTVKEIAEVKMASFGFYLDIISVFPVYIFANSLDSMNETISTQTAKLFPVLQVWHIWAYMQKWERHFDVNVKFLCLCKYFLLLLIACYWSGCFLYVYSCPKRLCRENSWMTSLIFFETKMYVTNDANHERPLLTSLSFGTAVFTGTGTADYVPGVSDVMVVVFLIIAGSYMYTAYMSEICASYLLSTQRKLKFKESMRELFYFLNVNHVSSKIKSRVKKFFTVQWYYNEAMSVKEIFRDISANIQQEVLSIEIVETLLFCPLFQDCSRDFLQTVASNATTVILPDQEVIQHGADISRDMYILFKGHCNVLNHHGKTVEAIGPGSHFGVIEMLYGLPKVYTVVTSTNCILRHIEYSSLIQSWSSFPESANPIFITIEQPELKALAAMYDDGKPLIGRLDNKTNRIAQEIKESFVGMNRDHEDRKAYVKTFDKMGYLRHIRYIFLPICITPYGIFLKIWCALRVAFAMFYVLVIPYYVAIRYSAHSEGYNWPDLFLYVDLIVMSYVAYYNKKSLLISHPLLAVSHYLKTTFLWDLICVFPFEEILRVINSHINRDMCRLNRLLLVFRITGAFSYWESDIMQVNPAVVMLKFIPFVISFVNLMAALVFMNNCIPININDNASHRIVSCFRNKSFNSLKKTETTEALLEYLHTLFWVFEIFVGCGCTPTTATGTVDVIMVMALRIAGFLYFAFMFGYIASTRSATAHSLLEHNENTKDLENFLYQENVDPALTARTLKYFEYVWKRTNGSNPQRICRRLNSALMEDTLVFMYERALREVPLFGKVERSFIRVITQHLSEMYFLKGETVVQIRDIQSYIYIIYRGKVDVLNSYNEMVSCMGPGGMFGNFTGQPTSCSDVSIFASRSLDLLVIPSQTFFSLVRYYPKLQEPLQKAFALSKDYILPITMNTMEDSSDEGDESDEDLKSVESGFDSRSGSSRFDYEYSGQLSARTSHSNVSTAKSSASVGTFTSYTNVTNLVRPGSWLFQGFGYLTSIMATINYVLITYEIVTLNDCLAIFWLQAVLDVYFFIKFFITMHMGYVSKRGDFIVDQLKCRSRYFKHKLWFWSDMLCNAPLEVFAFCFPKTLLAMHYLRVNKIFRVIYLIEFYRNTSAELTNNLTVLQSVTTVIVVILLLHSASCIWLITLVSYDPISLIRALKLHLVDEETPQLQWDYMTSIYVIVAELTGTGGDEFLVDKLIPLAILGVVLVCGKMLAAMVVATSIQISYSTKDALTKYERKTNELINMLKNQGLSVYQTKKFWKYVQQLWVNEHGRQLPVLLAATPYVHRCDLMSAMFGHHLRNCYLFADTGEAFLRQLTASLEYTIFFPGNYIVTEGNSEARMYWVTSGTVSVLSVRSDLTETTHEKLGPGDVFGILQGLTRGIVHVFSYRAETNVSILTLSLEAWANILQFFPEAQNVIFERSEFLFTQIDM